MSDIFEMKKQQLMKLSEEERLQRLVYYEVIWDALDSETKWWLQKLYSFFRGIRRDYNPVFGVLVGLKFDVKYLDVWVETKYEEWSEQKKYLEKKTVRISPSSLVQFDFIEERIDITELEKEGQ